MPPRPGEHEAVLVDGEWQFQRDAASRAVREAGCMAHTRHKLHDLFVAQKNHYCACAARIRAPLTEQCNIYKYSLGVWEEEKVVIARPCWLVYC
jgi:hypothetical protein